ncbi:MAG TPA: cobaltochelatase subunit CobN, partial [Streptosporangiaceae bacterium]|nr:cobaltochelatase subunit CobN [Streptosporangiaceae bacterium]
MLTVLLVSTADTELLAAAASGAGYLTANPQRSSADEVTALAARADLVVLRLLGGRKAWPDGVAALAASGTPLVALGGEASPDAELMALSTVPAGVATEALGYLREGGQENLRELTRFLSDTVFLTGEGFEPPRPMPAHGLHAAPAPTPDESTPVVAVVFYRAHELSGNTAFVDTLCAALAEHGAQPLPVFCASLRSADQELAALLEPADAVITTVLAAGGAAAADATSEGDWDAGVLAGLDVPVLQGLCLTSSRAQWEASNAALAPIDAAMQVAIPEFDGRLITVPFSFKEEGPDGIPRYAADPGRAARLAGIAVRHARLARTPNAAKRVAVMLSSYPTKHSRVGNAVGLDTPASAVALLRAMRAAGYDLGDGFPEDGDELIHALIAAGGHDTEWLTEEQLRAAPARVPLAAYRRLFSDLPNGLRDSIHSHWGTPPGELYADESTGDIVLACLRFGNVVLMIQPPRGFGENPVAIYHDPDLPPSHHYLAAYRWLAHDFGADAIVHLGKHGTLEWLPGKGLGLSAGCAPDAVLGDLPLVYPFIVNDPGEGTQAKRRAHAVIVDHLVPPMARADTYGELAKLEQLLDEYATVAALDPDKLPALRAQIWSLIQAAHLHQDLGVEAQPGSAEFDDFVLHIDGYLCEVKDAAIRDGLHVLGAAPDGEALVNLVLVILRAAQLWSARWGSLPGLRAALGLPEGGDTALAGTDRYERTARALIEAIAATGWEATQAPAIASRILAAATPTTTTATTPTSQDPQASQVTRVLEFACAEVVPRLRATSGEIDAVLHALDGGYVPAGPSGSPTRGLVNVLPTGRNFYSVDPKAIPSRNSFTTGLALADSLLARHLADEGEYPRCVGLTVWGTSAMRTQGDDIAEVLALIGCRPVW